MIEPDRDRLIKLEFQTAHTVAALADIEAKLDRLMPLAATVNAMTRALWYVAAVIATSIVGALVTFMLRGGFSIGGG